MEYKVKHNYFERTQFTSEQSSFWQLLNKVRMEVNNLNMHNEMPTFRISGEKWNVINLLSIMIFFCSYIIFESGCPCVKNLVY